MPADEGDAPMPERNQMIDRLPRAGARVRDHEIGVEPLDHARDLHDRNAGGQHVVEAFAIRPGNRADDDAVGPVLLQRFEHIGLAFEVVAAASEQNGQRLALDGVDQAAEHLGEIRIAQIVKGDAERVGARGAQGRGAAVIDIAHLAGDALHMVLGALGHCRIVAQGQRHGRGRNAQCLGDDFERHTPAFDAAIGRVRDRHAAIPHRCGVRATPTHSPVHHTRREP
jgi:hypothetical protein